MTQQAKRVTLFDAWAAQYDTAVAAGGQDFPFVGYGEVLDTAIRTAGARPSPAKAGVLCKNLPSPFVR
ncbi:MAG: hypothetical protein IPM39_09540 [Chloroflexi bacterium]|nr:hypothetical protein [Chloroflexota bacterium]